MSGAGAQFIEGLKEAVAVANGDVAAQRILYLGHSYISRDVHKQVVATYETRIDKQRLEIARLSDRVTETERRERDTGRELRKWQDRAHKSEAALASLTGQGL